MKKKMTVTVGTLERERERDNYKNSQKVTKNVALFSLPYKNLNVKKRLMSGIFCPAR